MHLNAARERGAGMTFSSNEPATDVASDRIFLDKAALSQMGGKTKAMLKAQLGNDIFTSWFNALEFESFDGSLLRMSVPVLFLKKWIHDHYLEELRGCCAAEFKGTERDEVILRQHGSPAARTMTVVQAPQTRAPQPATGGRGFGEARSAVFVAAPAGNGNSGARGDGPCGGSPLDPRCTFGTFVIGPANRMAHAGAVQVAETVYSEARGFNPLFIHASVGLGKTHLLHAIAWEVKRRTPDANVLYLTAERFRFEFLEALKAQDGLAFKDRFGTIDILLIDDLEFMQGEKTEQEFDSIINALIDGGRQVVVASARPPAQLDRMNERMRSRLQRGLVTELHAPDSDLRQGILAQRVEERRMLDPSFEVPRSVLQLLAERLTENGRELEGAVNRLYAQWQLMKTPVTHETAEMFVRDLVQGIEPRRIKIEDILRIIARHYAVSKADILSERRHRSIVWPRQIGMYLAKQLTARSLPEIGRRFGDRDHTTVLHAIRKVDRELEGNTRLQSEIDDLKKQLNR